MTMHIHPAPALQDVEVGGLALFQNFIHEELVHEGLPEDAIEIENPPQDVLENDGPEAQGQVAFNFDPALFGARDGFNNEYLRRIGGNIREIADQFAASNQRNLIREQAEHINLESITESSFSHMLEEVFINGISSSSIIALFYFCSDVLIRCVKKALYHLGKQLFIWALNFLVTNVCKWVYEHGGWERVFSRFQNFTMIASAAVALSVIIISGIIYIRNNVLLI